MVLDGATVVHSAGGMLKLTVTGATYISCGGAIDVTWIVTLLLSDPPLPVTVKVTVNSPSPLYV